MKRVTLYFPDVKDLRRFTQIVECSYMEMIADSLTLTCDCGEAEVELAEKGFNAKVVDLWPTGFYSKTFSLNEFPANFFNRITERTSE